MSIFTGIGSATKSGLNNMIRAREARVSRDVHAYLAGYDDESLARFGYRRDQLKTGGSFTGIF